MKRKTKKKITRFAIGFLMVVLALFFFRGCAYRTVVTYKDTGSHKNYKVKDKNLAIFIEDNLDGLQAGDINSIIDISQRITNQALTFSSDAKQNDPNKTVLLRQANSVGYASFTASTANYLIDKHKLSKVWEAKPVKGKLFLFGIDMHSETKSKTFKDQNFVIFKNKVTGKEISVDPTIYSYLKIDRISKY